MNVDEQSERDMSDLILDVGGPCPEGNLTSPHQWKLTPEGNVDTFAIEWKEPEGFIRHNGPACEVCGLAFCEHCHDWWATPCPSDTLDLPQ